MHIKVFTSLIKHEHSELSARLSANDKMEDWLYKAKNSGFTILDIDYSIRDTEMLGFIYTRAVIVVKYKIPD